MWKKSFLLTLSWTLMAAVAHTSSAAPVVGAPSAPISPILANSLHAYAKQSLLYAEGETSGEGEGEGEGESEGEPGLLDEFPWRYYAQAVGVVLLALGIVWAAEDPPSPCMVATAAYGTPMAAQLTLLRMFRDAYLLESPIGMAFVDVYYRSGTVAAAYVSNHDWAAWAVRQALRPLLFVAAFMLLFPGFVSAMSAAAVVGAIMLALAWTLRQRRQSTSCAPRPQ